MNKVTFDYSKASSFIQEHEIDSMKKLAMDWFPKQAPATISLAGLICL